MGAIRTPARTAAPAAPPSPADTARALVDACPQPALLASAGGRPLHANGPAAPIAAALAVAALSHDTARIAERTYDLTVMPWPSPDLLLILARDVTSERSLTEALVESRQLFKDLVACSSDFAWETDGEGKFSFVSKATSGYAPRDLVGRPARAFVAQAPAQGPLPFESDQPLQDVELSWRRADGREACLSVSCVPIRDRDGRCRGARGVAQDITEARAKDSALAAARNREALIDKILAAAHDEAEPQRMLSVAAEVAAKALGAGDARVLRRHDNGQLVTVAHWRDGSLAESVTQKEIAAADPLRLAADTRHRGRVNGGLRVAGEKPFDAEARALFAGVAAQLGFAVEQIALYDALDRLSRVDALTGLLNRRDFIERLTPRLAQLNRHGRMGTLLFVDLDNFKALNDRRGHAAGDQALIALSRLLADTARKGDLVARFGGDEFALWLEETDAGGAGAKADALIATVARDFVAVSAGPDKPLGLSIGIALWTGTPDGPVDPEALIARGDAAMYIAKHQGKNRWAISPAA